MYGRCLVRAQQPLRYFFFRILQIHRAPLRLRITLQLVCGLRTNAPVSEALAREVGKQCVGACGILNA